MDIMDIMEVMKARHSVRQYQDKRIGEALRERLDEAAETCNRESGLHIQIIYDDLECFDTAMAHYGKFCGVQNYIALAGKKSPELEEACGYYGERLVLLAQELGLNTCWVALTYGKKKCKAVLDNGERLVCVIALGYGVTQGVPHKGKGLGDVSDISQAEQAPAWFRNGVEAALLAPTAVNQQKFYFLREGERVRAQRKGAGFYTKLDLGIVKYHFEAASGHKAE